MSKLRFVLCGGWDTPAAVADEPYGRIQDGVQYSTCGSLLLAVGLALVASAPLLLMPSQFGVIPFEYDQQFLEQSSWFQYAELLWKNGLVVVKWIFGGDIITGVTLPVPPPTARGATILVLLTVLDAAAVAFFVTGALRIRENLKKWAENH